MRAHTTLVTGFLMLVGGCVGLGEAVMNMLAKQRYESGAKKGVKVKVRLLRIYTFRSG
jgi:hypothetical protein